MYDPNLDPYQDIEDLKQSVQSLAEAINNCVSAINSQAQYLERIDRETVQELKRISAQLGEHND